MRSFGHETANRGGAVSENPGNQAPLNWPAAAGPGKELAYLRRRNTALTEAVRARDAFLAVAAHELRNPMMPMLDQVDVLLDGLRAGKLPREQVEQRVERIRQAMERHLGRATALLDVSCLADGKLRLEPEPCDFAELAREVVAIYAGAARMAGSSIGVDAPASLPGTWDRGAIEQVIDNLISNAVKYGAGRLVAICVEDLGATPASGCGTTAPASPQATTPASSDASSVLSDAASGMAASAWPLGGRPARRAMEGTVAVDDAEEGGSALAVTVPRHTKVSRP